MSYVLGNDASYYQLDYNPETNKQVGMKFVIFRASYGEQREHDSAFREWYEIAYYSNYENGISAYHFLKPSHNFDKQMEWFQEQMEAVPKPNLSPLKNTVFFDCEHNDEKSPSYISEFIKAAAEYTKKYITIGNYPGIYTSSWWWNTNVERSNYWKKLPLWVANWTMQENPLLPADWEDWNIWQFSLLKNQGKYYGWASDDIDLNRMKIKDKKEFQLFMPAILNRSINTELYVY